MNDTAAKTGDQRSSINPPAFAEVQAERRSDDEILMALSCIEGLNPDIGMRSACNRHASYFRFLRIFIETNRDYPERIRAAFHEGQLDEVRRMAHTLKGSSGTLGIDSLHEMAAELESLIKRPPPKLELFVEAAIDALAVAMPKMLDDLGRLVEATKT